LKLPFAYVRSAAKTHGRQNLIEGQLPEGANVLVIEDLISTGWSSLQAVEALRDEGYTVIGVLAIFQYNLSAAKTRFAEASCLFETLSDFKTLVRVAGESGQIELTDISLLESWHLDPKAWDARIDN
jgi:orotate phosphoribosyltransferase